MHRNLFVSLFLVFAMTFVPVVFFFGLAAVIAPAAWGIFEGVSRLMQGDWRFSLFLAVHSILYLAVYYGLARGTFSWLSGLPTVYGVPFSLQLLVLLALFSCSFARIITYHSIQGSGHTHTFWSAAGRFLERQQRH